jgi:hypothetical protein
MGVQGWCLQGPGAKQQHCQLYTWHTQGTRCHLACRQQQQQQQQQQQGLLLLVGLVVVMLRWRLLLRATCGT